MNAFDLYGYEKVSDMPNDLFKKWFFGNAGWCIVLAKALFAYIFIAYIAWLITIPSEFFAFTIGYFVRKLFKIEETVI